MIERLVRRKGYSRGLAYKVIKSQLPPEKKIPVVDFVIENNGSLTSLRSKSFEVFKVIEADP